MVAVVVKERSGGGLQLLTQGTADIILDSCIEFWDGHDLCPLSASDRCRTDLNLFIQALFKWTISHVIPKMTWRSLPTFANLYRLIGCIKFYIILILQEKGTRFLSENESNIVLHRVRL